MHVFKTSQNVIHLFQVREHKTRATGPAPLILKPIEQRWLLDLHNIMVKNKVKTQYIFATPTGAQVKRLCSYMQREWQDAGLTAKVDFNLIRSSAATKVSFTKQTL